MNAKEFVEFINDTPDVISSMAYRALLRREIDGETYREVVELAYP